jgi:TolB-like protein/DNA-binding winged helix-turn-helix (wHTH) protein/Flp pilus assembly protein TadD
MSSSSTSREIVRFGVFELDSVTGDLRKSGVKLKLHDQPFQLLVMLLSRPGELVTREEIRNRLWPRDMFVDFDHGLNNAVARLREALGDSADSPRFVETLPRKGYRFIASADRKSLDPDSGACPPQTEPPKGDYPLIASARLLRPEKTPRRTWTRRQLIVPALLLLAASTLGITLYTKFSRRKAMARIRSIAVLPLQNMSHDSEQEYFADGMTEALIDNLSKIEALRVISRTSVMQYKAAHKSLPEIARELNVDAIVEGSVQRSGDQVRISAELIDGTSDSHMWERTFDRDLSDTLMLESEVAQAVAAEIQIRLTPGDTARIPVTHVANSKAHDAYLRGRYAWSTKTRSGLEQSIAWYQKAIEQDPQYALAYANMADSYVLLENDGYMPASEANPKIRNAAMNAVAADPHLAEAHLMLADVKETEWDWAAAEQEYRRAIELNPGMARAHHWYAILLTDLKRYDEAFAEIERAVELEPQTASLYLVQAESYYFAGRYDQALLTLDTSPPLQARGSRGETFAGLVLLRKGDYAQAISRIRTVVDSKAGNARDLATLGYAYALAGKKKEALASLHKLRHFEKGGYVELGYLATIWVGLGNKDKALDLLNKDCELHSSFLMSLATDPVFQPLHSDNRFQDLLRRIGLPSS